MKRLLPMLAALALAISLTGRVAPYGGHGGYHHFGGSGFHHYR